MSASTFVVDDAIARRDQIEPTSGLPVMRRCSVRIGITISRPDPGRRSTALGRRARRRPRTARRRRGCWCRSGSASPKSAWRTVVAEDAHGGAGADLGLARRCGPARSPSRARRDRRCRADDLRRLVLVAGDRPPSTDRDAAPPRARRDLALDGAGVVESNGGDDDRAPPPPTASLAGEGLNRLRPATGCRLHARRRAVADRDERDHRATPMTMPSVVRTRAARCGGSRAGRAEARWRHHGAARRTFVVDLDAAVAEADDALRVGGDVVLVRHQHDGDAVRLCSARASSDMISWLVVRVEIAGRLVGEDHRGSVTSARAMATRCCWPPESSARHVLLASGETDVVQRPARALCVRRRACRDRPAAARRSRARWCASAG